MSSSSIIRLISLDHKTGSTFLGNEFCNCIPSCSHCSALEHSFMTCNTRQILRWTNCCCCHYHQQWVNVQNRQGPYRIPITCCQWFYGHPMIYNVFQKISCCLRSSFIVSESTLNWIHQLLANQKFKASWPWKCTNYNRNFWSFWNWDIKITSFNSSNFSVYTFSDSSSPSSYNHSSVLCNLLDTSSFSDSVAKLRYVLKSYVLMLFHNLVL